MSLSVAEVKRRLPIYVNNPVLWAKEAVGFHPDPQQEKILAGYLDRGFDAVKSGHGVGKTATASIRGLHFLSTRPFSIVPCTAPTRRQLRSILWKEFAKWIRHSNYLSEILIWEAERIKVRGYESEWYAEAVTSRSRGADDSNVGLQGFHAGPGTGGIHYIVDEASGVTEGSMSAVEGALTEANAYALMIGNPTHLSGTFYNAFGKDKDLWHSMTLSCLDSSIVADSYPKRMAKKYGKYSDMYRVKVLGEFPTRESEGLVPLAFVMDAYGRGEDDVDPGSEVWGGLDVALSGANRTVLYLRHGNYVFFKALCEQDREEDIAEWLRENILRYDVTCVTVDAIGPGSGVISHMRKMGLGRKVRAFKSGDKPVGRKNDQLYFNARAQAYWYLRSLFYTTNIALAHDSDDELLTGQLTAIRVEPYGSKVKIEQKKDMKRRAIDSPDDADALVLCFANEVNKVRSNLPSKLMNFRPIKERATGPWSITGISTPESPTTKFGMLRGNGWRI